MVKRFQGKSKILTTLVIGLLGLVPMPSAQAQNNPTSEAQTLLFVIRTARGTNQNDLTDAMTTIEEQLKKEKRTTPSWKKVVIQPSSKTVYEQVQGLIAGNNAGVSAPRQSDKTTLIPINESQGEQYRIYTGLASDTILEMLVTDKTNDGDKKKSFIVTDNDPEKSPLFFNKSTYLYHFNTKTAGLIDPQQYTIVVDREPKAKILGPYPWPKDSYSYWTLRLEGWKGEVSELIKLFKNEEEKLYGLANGYDLAGAAYTTFGVGSALLDAPEGTGGGFIGNNIFQFVIPISNKQRKATRVWMMFPLSEDEAKQQKIELNKMGFNQVITYIEKKASKLPNTNQQWQFTPGMEAQWLP